jgi:hypothetical protein
MKASPAARRINMKTTATCRIVMCAPGTNEWLVFESQFEADCARVFWSMPEVRSVQAQYGPIPYTDSKGKIHMHYVDLRVEFMNGFVILYCVRPDSKVEHGELKLTVEDIRNHQLHYHADRIEILTEKSSRNRKFTARVKFWPRGVSRTLLTASASWNCCDRRTNPSRRSSFWRSSAARVTE